MEWNLECQAQERQLQPWNRLTHWGLAWCFWWRDQVGVKCADTRTMEEKHQVAMIGARCCTLYLYNTVYMHDVNVAMCKTMSHNIRKIPFLHNIIWDSPWYRCLLNRSSSVACVGTGKFCELQTPGCIKWEIQEPCKWDKFHAVFHQKIPWKPTWNLKLSF